VIVRTATPSDAREVTRLYVASENAGFGKGRVPLRAVTEELVERWRRDLGHGPQRWWIAENDGRAVGFVGIGPSRDPRDPDLGELDTIAVDPDHWRQGVGRALLQVAEAALVDDGYEVAILWTVAHYELGYRFYEAMRWKLDGATRDEGRQVMFRRILAHR
jgi:N-acetylglutamate synthase-like GNAT family acetyltransferase